MRHLSLAVIFGALLVTACDANKPKVKTSSIQGDTTYTTTDNGTFVQEDTTTTTQAGVVKNRRVQAQEVSPRLDERKTYNEKQISDDESDYPIDKSSRGETYEETQKSL